VSVGIGVVSSGEVSVVARHNAVLLTLGDVLPVPLSDARSAGVGQQNSAELTHRLRDAVALDGGTNLDKMGDGSAEVGGEGAIYGGIQGGKVDFNNLRTSQIRLYQ